MSEPAGGVIVTHARLGEALVEAAEEISGVEGALVAISNRDASPARLLERVAAAVGEGPAVVFVDLASGSCGFAARAAVRTCGASVIVTGVSLPILLDFLFHRDLPLAELADRLVDKGRSNITAAGPSSRDDAARAVPD